MFEQEGLTEGRFSRCAESRHIAPGGKLKTQEV
jgi:hypothetical protein